jgi:hypothetical protein
LKEAVTNTISYGVPLGGGVHEKEGEGKKLKSAENETRAPRPLEHVKSAVLLSLRSPESQRSYQHSIDDFVAWYCSAPRLSFNKTVVIRYRISLEDRQLAPGTINVRLAAVRRLAYEAADSGLPRIPSPPDSLSKTVVIQEGCK